jgi:hypothetical protein
LPFLNIVFDSEKEQYFQQDLQKNIQVAFICEEAELKLQNAHILLQNMLKFLCDIFSQLHVLCFKSFSKNLDILRQIAIECDFNALSFSELIFFYFSLFYDQTPQVNFFKKIGVEIERKMLQILNQIIFANCSLNLHLQFLKSANFFGKKLTNRELI